jgi:hypothetical protein
MRYPASEKLEIIRLVDASRTAVATNTSALFGIYRWGGAAQRRRPATATSP